MDQLLQAEFGPLAGSVGSLSKVSGQEFLDLLVGEIGEITGAEVVVIGALRVTETDRIKVHALYARSPPLRIDEYEACNSPCHEVVTKGIVKIVPGDLASLYPNEPGFQTLGLDSYIGIPLLNGNGEPIGLMLAEHTTPLEQSQVDMVLEVLACFAERVSQELINLQNNWTLGALIQGPYRSPSLNIFRVLVQQFAEAFLARAAFIAECLESDPDHFRVLAYCFAGDNVAEAEQALVPYSITPCQHLKEHDSFLLPHNLQSDYPKEKLFAQQRLHAYVGTVLRDSENRVIGHIALLHDREISSRVLDSTLLSMFANRAGSELQRYQSDAQRKKYEDILLVRHKTESLGLLAGTISHDFNNLLASVLGRTELALDELADGSLAYQHLSKAQSALLSAKDLVQQLSTYASGLPEPKLVQGDLNDLVRQTVELSPMEKRSGKTITLALDEGLPTFPFDHTQITQLLLNLLFNALDAIEARPGGIVITTSQVHLTEPQRLSMIHSSDQLPADCAVLEVRDEGIGMSRETAVRIFDPFYSTKNQGRGLGMASVLSIIRRHGAGLAMDSAIGQGTMIRVYFGLSDEELEQAAPGDRPDADAEPRAKGDSNRRILVIDDEAPIREVVALQLEGLGYQAIQASSCSEALSALSEGPEIWATIVDIGMPDCDGWETVIRLRERDPKLQAIMMSGFAARSKPREARVLSGVAVIDKPFRRATLVEALDALDGSDS